MDFVNTRVPNVVLKVVLEEVVLEAAGRRSTAVNTGGKITVLSHQVMPRCIPALLRGPAVTWPSLETVCANLFMPRAPPCQPGMPAMFRRVRGQHDSPCTTRRTTSQPPKIPPGRISGHPTSPSTPSAHNPGAQQPRQTSLMYLSMAYLSGATRPTNNDAGPDSAASPLNE
jgi:hypothetical protein